MKFKIILLAKGNTRNNCDPTSSIKYLQKSESLLIRTLSLVLEPIKLAQEGKYKKRLMVYLHSSFTLVYIRNKISSF